MTHKLEDGTVAIIRVSGRPPAPCQACGKRYHSALCDAKIGGGRTCDVKLCEKCTQPDILILDAECFAALKPHVEAVYPATKEGA